MAGRVEKYSDKTIGETLLDPEHGETFPWDVEKLAAKIYLLGSHMGTSGDLCVP